MKKTILYGISIAMAVLFLTTVVCAHSTSQSTELDTYTNNRGFVCVGSESIGWGVRETSHLGTCSAEYKFDSGLDSRYRTMFLDAAELWTSTTQATMTQSSSAIGTVAQGRFTEEFYAASFKASGTDGHLIWWEIQINTLFANKVTSKILAHEIGHLWGLADLYADYNTDKLMYYAYDSTATAPTDSDIKGFNVITGLHTTHQWTYTNTSKRCTVCDGIKTESHSYVWTDYSASHHKGVCSICNKTVYESHAPYYNAIRGCVKCLRKTPIQEIASLLPPDDPIKRTSVAVEVIKE